MDVRHFGMTPWLLRSVDIELVAFRVLHPDRVVVEPFLGQCASDGGAQAGQPAGLRVDSLPASPDRVRPPATGVDVEVQPVLDHLGIRDGMEPDARPVAVWVADPVRPVDQLLLGHPQLAVVVVAGSCAARDRLARFWAAALGYELAPVPDGFATWNDFYRQLGVPEEELVDGTDRISDPDGHGPSIWFHAVPDAKVVKNRLHLDIHASGERTDPIETRRKRVDAEASRLAGLGATITGALSEEGL